MDASSGLNEVLNENGYTIGIGVTDRCNAECPHCYSRPYDRFHDLDFELIRSLIDAIPIKSVNFGTGESILYERFTELVNELAGRGISLSLTTNGYTVAEITDEDLRKFHDIDFSLDFPDEKDNDNWRGKGAYKMVMEGVERCLKLGIEASLVGCLMKSNHSQMGRLAEKAIGMGLNLRINVYKPVFTSEFKPSYHEFWLAVGEMAETAYFISCSEPIVNAALGRNSCKQGSPCGKKSFRIHPDGKVVPCVYMKDGKVSVQDLLTDLPGSIETLRSELALLLPEVCRDCQFADICQGGCSSRRLFNNPGKPDEYCFVVNGDIPQIDAKWKGSKNLVHEDYLCTMIFSG